VSDGKEHQKAELGHEHERHLAAREPEHAQARQVTRTGGQGDARVVVDHAEDHGGRQQHGDAGPYPKYGVVLVALALNFLAQLRDGQDLRRFLQPAQDGSELATVHRQQHPGDGAPISRQLSHAIGARVNLKPGRLVDETADHRPHHGALAFAQLELEPVSDAGSQDLGECLRDQHTLLGDAELGAVSIDQAVQRGLRR
jgi:hypothetical protein